jgi:Zn-dependent peptidase ImmA (M78 family)
VITNLFKGYITFEELLRYYNANISYINLPDRINGFVFSYKNINNIFINDFLSYDEKKKTILHELAHIELDQLGQIDKDLFAFKVNEYEDEADKYIQLLGEYL